MDHPFWLDRWGKGQIAFHLGEVNPHLSRLAARLPPGRVLVPLCGKSADLAYLAARGHDVVGVEFVEEAARAFFAERALVPEEIRVGAAPALRHQGLTIVVGDFFALDRGSVGAFDAIYDRAALVAIEPARRRTYIEQLRALAAPDSRLLLVTMDHDLEGGPPFSIGAEELAELVAGHFELEACGRQDALEPRQRDRGATRFVEHVWLGRAV